MSLCFNDVTTALPHIRTGCLRGLAVTSLKRSPAAPEMPTIAESGYPGFQSDVWYGVLAPAHTPADIVARLYAELVKSVRTPEFLQGLAAKGAVALRSMSARLRNPLQLAPRGP